MNVGGGMFVCEAFLDLGLSFLGSFSKVLIPSSLATTEETSFPPFYYLNILLASEERTFCKTLSKNLSLMGFLGR